ncbi:polyprotein [Elysia marginata]|uniref:Polyprotein n=1 Tax=Elysia marginata TaxID=1093978 RepID=A0AAV4IC89_9GAST|nr:polyprotein [Elysia marginata]
MYDRLNSVELKTAFEILDLKIKLFVTYGAEVWGLQTNGKLESVQIRQTTEHVLSSCKVALSQGRYTWRHNRVLQELASVISIAKGQSNPPSLNFTIFTTEGGARKWCGRSNTASNQRKGLLDGCDDWEVSADLPEWDKHPEVIRRTTLRPDIVIHSPSTQQVIMVELTVPYESRMEQAHTYKKEKYLDLTKELEKSGYRAKIMPIEIGARGFAGSSAYDLLSKLNQWQQTNKSLETASRNSRKQFPLDLVQKK